MGIEDKRAHTDRMIAETMRQRASREQGYRERALKIYPWICGRCARSFDASNVQQLEVHHKNSNHHDNPPDGSNWELLCTYCHENEHSREADALAAKKAGVSGGRDGGARATAQPFANLKDLLAKK